MREISKKDIQSMDTPNLTKMRNIIRDKWTWETGSDEDKEFLDFIEGELDTREVTASTPEPYFEIVGEAIKFNGGELFEKSYDYQQNVTLAEDLSNAIKKMVCDNISGYSYGSYGTDNIGDSILEKVDGEFNSRLYNNLHTVISGIVTIELSNLENQLRNDFRIQLDALKFELENK